MSVFHINPGYTRVTIWRSKRGERICQSIESPDKGLTRYQRFEVIRDFLQGEGFGRIDYRFTRNDKTVQHAVLLRSGRSGWRSRLKATYKNLAEFKSCCSVYGNRGRLGHITPEAAWLENPVIEGSTNPADYRKAKNQA